MGACPYIFNLAFWPCKTGCAIYVKHKNIVIKLCAEAIDRYSLTIYNLTCRGAVQVRPNCARFNLFDSSYGCTILRKHWVYVFRAIYQLIGNKSQFFKLHIYTLRFVACDSHCGLGKLKSICRHLGFTVFVKFSTFKTKCIKFFSDKTASSWYFWLFNLPDLTSFKTVLEHETIEGSFALP